MPTALQWAGLVILAAGIGLVFGVGWGLVVFGVGVLAFGVAAEREVTEDGSSTPTART